MDGDERRVPAAPPSFMERGMLKVLAQAQGSAASGASLQVCGLSVWFSKEGHADVSWDLASPQSAAAEQFT